MSDLINRQAAIDALWSLDAELRPSAIDAILNMLNGLPSAQPEIKTDGDMISRAEAIEIVNFECGEWEGLAKTIVNGIKKLPSAQPENNCSEIPNSSDLIDRQAAIDYCYQLINVEHQQGSDEMNYGQERVNQTETILHHLELMPSAKPERKTDDDAISKQAALDILDEFADKCIEVVGGSYERARKEMCDLPATQPERKTGRWIYGEHDVAMCDGYYCSECGFFVPWDYKHKFIDFIRDYNFCPNCGSPMMKEGEW